MCNKTLLLIASINVTFAMQAAQQPDSTLFNSAITMPQTQQGHPFFPLLPSTIQQLGDDGRVNQLATPVIIEQAQKDFIIAGGALMHSITNNPPINALDLQAPLPAFAQAFNNSQQEYLTAIISIMWYLYSEAINKQQAFVEGSFIVLDPEYKLYNMLMYYVRRRNDTVTGTNSDPLAHSSNNPFAYSRDSSHWKNTQAQWKHYGIDMRFGADQESQSLLPTEKRHLLFGIVAAEPTPRLFIKFEHNGIYAGTGLTGKLTNCGELLGHGFNYLVSRGTKLEKTMPEWWYNTLLKPIVGSDEGPEARREHPSVAFIRTCTAMLQNTPELSARYLPQLTNGGIRQLRDFVKHKPADLPDWLHQAFERYYQQLCRILDYPEIRKGCEVILGQDELFSSLYYHCFAHNQAEQATQAGLLYERLKKQHAIRTELNHIHSAIEDRLRENRPIEPELMQQAQATGQRLERYQAALQAVINQYQPTAH